MGGNLFWGMQFRTCEKFWESTDLGLVLSQNFSQIQKPHRHYFDCDSLHESTANQTQNAESALDSAPSQNLVNLNPCEAPKTKFLLRLAFAKSRVPLNFIDSNPPSKADFAESVLDSADFTLSKHDANSSIADEFLGFCEASDDDRTLSPSRKRDEAIPKKSLRDAEFAPDSAPFKAII